MTWTINIPSVPKEDAMAALQQAVPLGNVDGERAREAVKDAKAAVEIAINAVSATHVRIGLVGHTVPDGVEAESYGQDSLSVNVQGLSAPKADSPL